MAVVQSVETLADVHLQDPLGAAPHRLPPERIQRFMSRAATPEAERAVVKVPLVDDFQNHEHRPLEHFVFDGRDANRTFLRGRTALGDVHPTHRRGLVAARLGPFQERLKIDLQVRLVVVPCLAIHARCSVFPRLVKRFSQQLKVQAMIQGSECQLRVFPRQNRYPPKFREHVHEALSLRHVSLQRSHNSTPPFGFSFPPPARSELRFAGFDGTTKVL